jgi:hypothetical protein
VIACFATGVLMFIDVIQYKGVTPAYRQAGNRCPIKKINRLLTNSKQPALFMANYG